MYFIHDCIFVLQKSKVKKTIFEKPRFVGICHITLYAWKRGTRGTRGTRETRETREHASVVARVFVLDNKILLEILKMSPLISL